MTATAESNDNGNGKVTMAVLRNDVTHLCDRFDRIEKLLEDYLSKEADTEKKVTALETRMDNAEGSIKNWNIINSIGVVIAGILAAAGLSKP